MIFPLMETESFTLSYAKEKRAQFERGVCSKNAMAFGRVRGCTSQGMEGDIFAVANDSQPFGEKLRSRE